ncbi:SCO family protein [Kaarinaea lacus]
MADRKNSTLPVGRSYPLYVLIMLAISGLAFFSTAYSENPEQRELERALNYVLLPKPTGLKPFQLTDQSNKIFGLDELKDKWTFIYFGYTSCPDVCPMTTDELNIVAKKIAAEPAYLRDTQFVFVSVDPYRDTPELLKKFTGYFDFNLLGVVAPVEVLNQLTEQLGVFHRRLIVQDRETKQQEYAVEHSADIYLIDPQGRPVAKFSSPHYGKEIAQLYMKIRQMAQLQSSSI